MNPDELRKLLGRRIGPMPAWAWIALVAVGVAAASAIRRSRTPAPIQPTTTTARATTADAPDPIEPFASGGFTVGGSGGGTNATGQGVTPSPLPNTPAPEVVTNADWEQAAARYAIARNLEPVIVTRALAQYLAGEQLDPQELAIINTVLRNVGTPPEPVPPPQAKPTPTPVPGTTAPPPAVVTPAPTPAPSSPIPDWLIGYRFVKAEGSTATYLVQADGLRWIQSYPELEQLTGAKGPAAAQFVSVFPISLMRTVKRVGTLPPPGTDTSL